MAEMGKELSREETAKLDPDEVLARIGYDDIQAREEPLHKALEKKRNQSHPKRKPRKRFEVPDKPYSQTIKELLTPEELARRKTDKTIGVWPENRLRFNSHTRELYRLDEKKKKKGLVLTPREVEK